MSSKEQPVDKEAFQTVLKLLKSNVQRVDVPNIESELKKDFVFAKKKSKIGRKNRCKKKTKYISRKEKKNLGFYSLPRNDIKYKDVLPMHAIWTEYMRQILELDKLVVNPSSKGWQTFTQSLYKSDFHGSILQVVRSKCPSYVGKIGICVMDTKNTFKIVSENNLLTTIPKKDSVFELYLSNLRISLFGKHFCVRPAERSTKKIKSQLHPDL